jgi:tetratricopeptide (TPR) repeat protein
VSLHDPIPLAALAALQTVEAHHPRPPAAQAAAGFEQCTLSPRPALRRTRQAPHRVTVNNNMGYSLIQIYRFHEAIVYLQAALGVDRARPNALKNLGLAMQGLERHAKAAEYFVAATRTDPRDRRSLEHLPVGLARRRRFEFGTDLFQRGRDALCCRLCTVRGHASSPATRSDAYTSSGCADDARVERCAKVPRSAGSLPAAATGHEPR